MPATALPPTTPAAEVRQIATMAAPTSPSSRLTQSQAEEALARLRMRQTGTPFVGARPAGVPGLVTILLPDNKVAYTDISGRYYIVGVAFDLDTGRALDGALDGHPTGN